MAQVSSPGIRLVGCMDGMVNTSTCGIVKNATSAGWKGHLKYVTVYGIGVIYSLVKMIFAKMWTHPTTWTS